jgi:hypothetical protein
MGPSLVNSAERFASVAGREFDSGRLRPGILSEVEAESPPDRREFYISIRVAQMLSDEEAHNAAQDRLAQNQYWDRSPFYSRDSLLLFGIAIPVVLYLLFRQL